MSFSCYQFEAKKIPKLKLHPFSFPLHSFHHPFSPFSPFLAVRCYIEDSDRKHTVHVFWLLYLSALGVSLSYCVSEHAWKHNSSGA